MFSGANRDSWMFTLKGQTGTIDVTTSVLSAGLALVSATGSMDVTIASAELGYQWMWSSFNMQLRAEFLALVDQSQPFQWLIQLVQTTIRQMPILMEQPLP